MNTLLLDPDDFIQQNVNAKVVSERLGHASIQITLDTYSHLLPGLQEAAIERFDAAMASDPIAKN